MRANTPSATGPQATVMRASRMCVDQVVQQAGGQHGVAEAVGGDEQDSHFAPLSTV